MARGLVELLEVEVLEDDVEIAPVQHVQLAIGQAAAAHFLHGGVVPGAPSIGKSFAVDGDAARGKDIPCLACDRAAPIDQRAEHVEDESLYGFHERASCWRGD